MIIETSPISRDCLYILFIFPGGRFRNITLKHFYVNKNRIIVKITETPTPQCWLHCDLYDESVSIEHNVQVKVNGTYILIEANIFWIICA